MASAKTRSPTTAFHRTVECLVVIPTHASSKAASRGRGCRSRRGTWIARIRRRWPRRASPGAPSSCVPDRGGAEQDAVGEDGLHANDAEDDESERRCGILDPGQGQLAKGVAGVTDDGGTVGSGSGAGPWASALGAGRD
jgi:hypothetical protein